MKKFEIKVSGKVQGVFYRANCQVMARKLGVKGFVRNETDGSVYIEAEGEEQNLVSFLDWCKKGSDQAQVEKLSHVESQPEGYNDFVIQQ